MSSASSTDSAGAPATGKVGLAFAAPAPAAGAASTGSVMRKRVRRIPGWRRPRRPPPCSVDSCSANATPRPSAATSTSSSGSGASACASASAAVAIDSASSGPSALAAMRIVLPRSAWCRMSSTRWPTACAMRGASPRRRGNSAPPASSSSVISWAANAGASRSCRPRRTAIRSNGARCSVTLSLDSRARSDSSSAIRIRWPSWRSMMPRVRSRPFGSLSVRRSSSSPLDNGASGLRRSCARPARNAFRWRWAASASLMAPSRSARTTASAACASASAVCARVSSSSVEDMPGRRSGIRRIRTGRGGGAVPPPRS